MNKIIRIKYWLFDWYWTLIVCLLISTLGFLFAHQTPISTIATVVGTLLSIAYFLQKQKLEETRLFREIFKECNARYDSMNEELNCIALKEPQNLSQAEHLKVIDYLNLCGEEYLYFKRGYIEPSVWDAWHNGMKSVILAPSIRSIWDHEKKTGSYYDLPL